MTLAHPESLRVRFPLDAVSDACRRYAVGELAVFGSVLRDDFDPEGRDIDFLVRFIDNGAGPWMGKFTDMEEELTRLLGRKVDLVDWGGVEQSTNPYRPEHILKHARTIYPA